MSLTIITGEFATEAAFLRAWRALRAAGLNRFETSVPHAVSGLEDELPPTPIARFVLGGAACGGIGAYLLQAWAARDYPLNVSGRPLHSWPAFIPVTFELAVLLATLAGVAGLCWLCGLPRLDSPLRDIPGIERATQDRYFLGVRSDDPRFAAVEVRHRLREAGAEHITEAAP
ncbi:MAG TPA: DUF3341 domain-containing protein [Lacunisphaera sp.]|nr:DUF3341 domain-containing protein [Lacunisphaera sp.]